MARVTLIKLFTGLNLGVAQLAGELRRAGHDARIIYLKDFYVVPADERKGHLHTPYEGVAVGPRGREFVWNCYKPISEEEYRLLLDLLRDHRPDLVGFSLTSNAIEVAAEVTQRIKAELDVPVIWGGAGPTLEPERCLQFADLVCINEGEEVIVELARRLDEQRPLTDVAGVWATDGGRIVKTSNRPLLSLDSIANPDFSTDRTFHIEDGKLTDSFYPNNLGHQYAIMTSRGCPFSCSFCIESVYQDMFGKKGSLRRRSVDLVISELDAALDAYEIGSVMFYDDVFTTHRAWLREFAPRYRDEIGLPFWCYTYPTTTRAEDLRLLKDAGCAAMTMGIQSGSQRILNERFNRPTDLERARDAIAAVLDAGIECFFDLITAVDFETEDDLRATFEFLMALPRGVKNAGIGRMTRFPNYGYTASVRDSGLTHAVDADTYAYYHRLYLLALTDRPEAERREIAANPAYREDPSQLEAFLPTAMPFVFLNPGMKGRRRPNGDHQPRVLDSGIAQSTFRDDVSGLHEPSESDRDLGATLGSMLKRRLPVAT